MHTTGSRPKLVVSADGRGVVSHAGSRLLADLPDGIGPTGAFTDGLRRLRPRGTGHDPGRIAVDLAVMLADGGEALADLALLRDQREVFGPVASTATAWRLLADIGPAALTRLRSARAVAREIAWLQAAETTGGIPAARAGGRDLPSLVLDLDATLVTCHSEKNRQRRPTNAATATTRSFASWTTPAKPWPGYCGRAMPAPTPHTFEHCASGESTPSSPSDTSSPNQSAAQSVPCPTTCGTPRWSRTAPCAPAPKWQN